MSTGEIQIQQLSPKSPIRELRAFVEQEGLDVKDRSCAGLNQKIAAAHVPIPMASLQIGLLGAPGDAVPEDECDRAAMISHHQAAAPRAVLRLAGEIKKELERRQRPTRMVWVDKKRESHR